MGDEIIESAEENAVKKAMDRLSQIPNLLLLGNNNLPKVPIFSFVIKSKMGKILSPYIVSSLFNDTAKQWTIAKIERKPVSATTIIQHF